MVPPGSLGDVERHPIFLSHFGLLGPYEAMPRERAERRLRTTLSAPDGSARLAAAMRGDRWCHAPHKARSPRPLRVLTAADCAAFTAAQDLFYRVV